MMAFLTAIPIAFAVGLMACALFLPAEDHL